MTTLIDTDPTSEELRDDIMRITGVQFSRSECRKSTLHKIRKIAIMLELKKEEKEEEILYHDGY